MTIPRRQLVDGTSARFYHLTTRCVRRAFLQGKGFEHRKRWIYQRLRTLVDIFPVAVGGYAVLDNHLHLLVRYDPTAPQAWSADEIACRWTRLHPRAVAGMDELEREAHLAGLAARADWVEQHRAKLASLGWFMRELKWWLACKANREDRCSGHFWEGRYRSTPLLDEAARATCLAYIDLNPVRAGTATLPEEAEYTSIRERALAAKGRKPLTSQEIPPRRLDLRLARTAGGERHPAWMLPISDCILNGDSTTRDGELVLRRYLSLVDQTGRCLRRGKRGSIPPDARQILDRLGLEPEAWVACMQRGGQLGGTGLGHYAARAAEAARRSVNWLANRCRLFAARPVVT